MNILLHSCFYPNVPWEGKKEGKSGIMIKHLRLGVFDEEIFLFFVIICLIGFAVGCKVHKTIAQDVTADISPIVEASEPSECNLPNNEPVLRFALKTGNIWLKGNILKIIL